MDAKELLLTIWSVLGLGSVMGSLIKHWIDKRRKKKEQLEDDHDTVQKQKRDEETRCLIRSELKQVSEKIDKLQEDVTNIQGQAALNAEGSVTLLRDRMKCSLNYCKRQGYKTWDDARNWNELFKTYTNLGGNHFREYVNSWKEEMDALPTRDE